MDKNHLFRIIEKFLEKHTPPFPWGVAVSGGSDSLALALLLKDFFPLLHALVVDHGLRAESQEESLKACQILRSHHITPSCARVVWNTQPKTRIQEQARYARHQAFKEASLNWGLQSIFLGHTFDDQIETFLSRLIHASGPRGLCGMAEVQSLPELPINLYRPLLTISKKDLQSFLKSQEQFWISDPSNQNPRFERVRLRQFIAQGRDIPWEKVSQSLHKIREERAALEGFCQRWAQSCPHFPYRVPLQDILEDSIGLIRLQILLQGLDMDRVRSRSVYLLQQRISEGQTSTLGKFRFECKNNEVVVASLPLRLKNELSPQFKLVWIS